jgi:mannose-6-phosphate isomerase-like protein (cupin superfamily)
MMPTDGRAIPRIRTAKQTEYQNPRLSSVVLLCHPWAYSRFQVSKRSMTSFSTRRLPVLPEAVAPDGTDVRTLLQLAGGSLAHFELAPGKTSKAVAHRTVEEIWYFVGGRGEMWRRQAEREEIVAVDAGVALTIPLGTAFQFHAFGDKPLRMIVFTMPPWPGADEAYDVEGQWEPTIRTND